MSEVKVQSKSTAGLSFDGVVSAECCRSEHCFHMTNANGQKVKDYFEEDFKFINGCENMTFLGFFPFC